RYDDPRVQLSGLMCLSTAMVERLGEDYVSVIEDLRSGHYTSHDLAESVFHLSKDILDELAATRDGVVDVIRALVYLQRQDAAVRAAAHSYLRCEDLSRFDRESLGDMVPRTDDSHPLEMIESLGYLMWTVHGQPLVLFVDQLEEMYNLENAKELFRRAMGALNTVAENVPSSIVVIACLEDYYEHLKTSLARSLIDRLERNPDRIRLESLRSEDEILDLVAARLAVLYEDTGMESDPADRTFPIPTAELRQRQNTRTRDVLDWCRRYQEDFRSCGAGVSTAGGTCGTGVPPAFSEPIGRDGRAATEGGRDGHTTTETSPAITLLEERWQTFQAEGKWTVPADEVDLAGVLARALEHSNSELPSGRSARARAEGRFIEIKLSAEQGQTAELLIGVCNKRPQGGGLARQVEELEERASGKGRFIVRSMDFPGNP
ncbi:MAG: hypothetical protein ACREHD_26705, partial [Pirellulales bacterium]